MNKEIEIEKQYHSIIEHFPNIITIKSKITHIKIELIKGIFLEINYSNYPKRPKVILTNQLGEVFNNLYSEITSLKNWKTDETKSILTVINEISSILKNLKSNTVQIKKDLLDGIFALCRAQHPKEILGILKMENGIFTEYILPPGAITSRHSGILFLNRLPFSRSYQGTIHSHPSGVPFPSLQDLNSVFKRLIYHFIVGFPYTMNSIKCFDKNGKEIPFKVIN